MAKNGSRAAWTTAVEQMEIDGIESADDAERAESEIQRAIMADLRRDGSVGWWSRFQSGAVTDAKSGKPLQLHPAGTPDLGGWLRPVDDTPAVWFWIEVKAASGRTSAAQTQFLANARAQGLRAGVARSVADGRAIRAGIEVGLV